MYNLSHYYNEPSIFKRVLYGFILTIVSGIIAVGTVFAFTATLATNSAQAITTTATISPLIAQFLIGFFVVILVTFIVWIINAFLYWQAFNKLGERSGVDAFKTAGVLFIIGAVLTVVAVGIIITWVAWIYAALGYRRLNPQPLPAPIATSTPPPLGTSRIYCQNCGTENQAYAVYCGNCGKPLTPNQTSV
jgi:uncharacterized membrane protein